MNDKPQPKSELARSVAMANGMTPQSAATGMITQHIRFGGPRVSQKRWGKPDMKAYVSEWDRWNYPGDPMRPRVKQPQSRLTPMYDGPAGGEEEEWEAQEQQDTSSKD